MSYPIGRQWALRDFGFSKTAAPIPPAPISEDVLDNILRRLARGRSRVPLDTIQKPTLPELLIGRPQEVIHPVGLWRNVASLEPTRRAILNLRGMGPEGAAALTRLKGLGGLGIDLLHKGLVFGLPGYLIYKALKKPTPGKTRGEEIGRAVGQSLGWLPPMGILGTAATVAAPRYSMPGLLGTLGEHAGGAISQLVGERPATPELPSLNIRSAT